MTRASPRLVELAPAYVELSPAYVELSPAYVELSPAYVELSPAYIELSPAYVELSSAYVELSMANYPRLTGSSLCKQSLGTVSNRKLCIYYGLFSVNCQDDLSDLTLIRFQNRI